MNEVYASYRIPTSRLESLQKTVQKLANRIKKGKTEADYPPTIEATRDIVMVSDGGITRPINNTRVYSKDAIYIPYVWVTIKYQQPIVNGWHLIAVYDWEVTEDGKRTCFVSTVPGQMVLPMYREVEDGECDHCHTNRRRNKSMLITKRFMEYKVVGSTCIKDFLGHKNPNTFMDIFTFERTLSEYNHETQQGAPTLAIYPVLELLTITSMMVRKYGYVKTNDWDDQPTASRVTTYLHPDTQVEREYVINNVPSDTDKAKAEGTIEWIKEQDGHTDYMSSLQKCIEAGAISHKRFGILCSAVSVYIRAIEKTIEENAPKSNEWLGEPKERLLGIIASVKRVRYINGQYGTTTIITLITGSGDTLVWFASGDIDVEQYDVWRFDATVKKHDEFRGTKQTVVSRVKFVLQCSDDKDEKVAA